MSNIKIYIEQTDATSTLVLKQVYEMISKEIDGANLIKENIEIGEKSEIVSAIIIPLVVGISSTLVYDLIKLSASRIINYIKKEEKKVIYLKVEDESGKVTTIKLGE